MYQKEVTIRLSEQSSLYQNLCIVAEQKGTTVDALFDKIFPVGIYAQLERNLEFVIQNEYSRLPAKTAAQPMKQ